MFIYFINKFYLKSEPLIDGEEIYVYVQNNKNDTEHSRFNIKTKETTHEYALEIANNILNNKKKYKKVLVLGVALGSLIVHLHNKDPEMIITGIDIEDTYFHVVEKYADKNRLRLLKQDAYEYVLKSKETYDLIVCDIFDIAIPDFVLSKEFLKGINAILHSKHSKFILNTLDVDKKVNVKKKLQKIFKDYDITVINPKTVPNVLYVLDKR